MSSTGPAALFDLPGYQFTWVSASSSIFRSESPPCFGGVILVGLTALTEFQSRGPAKASSRHAVVRSALAAEGRRNAEVLQAMGMRRQAAERWQDVIRNISRLTRDLAISVAGSVAFQRPFGHFCNRSSSRSALIWSSIRNLLQVLYCQLDPDCQGACPSRDRNRKLEGLRRSKASRASPG